MLREELLRKKTKKLTWHDINMNFLYFIMVSCCLIISFLHITGHIYSKNAIILDRIYNSYTGLQAVNIVYGVVMLVVVALLIYTRYLFDMEIPYAYKWLVIIIALFYFSVIIHSFLSAMIQNNPISIAKIIINFGFCVALIIINNKYYKNREVL